MKKSIFVPIMCLTSFLMVNAQQESGVVYSEHESIDKAKAMWAAFVKGDKEAFVNFFSDTIRVIMNGVPSKKLKKDYAQNMDWWQGVENLTQNRDGECRNRRVCCVASAICLVPSLIVVNRAGVWCPLS